MTRSLVILPVRGVNSLPSKSVNIDIFGETMIRSIISERLFTNFDSKVVSELISIVSGTNIDLTTIIFDESLRKFECSKENPQCQQIIKELITKFVLTFQANSEFISLMKNYCRRTSDLQFSVLKLLDPEISFILLTIILSTDNSQTALIFLDKQVMPKLLEKPEFSPPKQYYYLLDASESQLKQQFYQTRNYGLVPIEIYQCKCTTVLEPIPHFNNSVSLRSVMAEANEITISSKGKLLSLLSFYPNFDESNAAVLILSLVEPNSKLERYFSGLVAQQSEKIFKQIKDIFIEKNIDMKKTFKKIDCAEFDFLRVSSVSLLFQCFDILLDSEPIDVNFLLSEWKNNELQLSILKAATSKALKGVKFAPDGEIPYEGLENMNPNNCWSSMKFSECIFKLIARSKPDLESFAIPMPYPFWLIAAGQKGVPRTKEIIEVASSVFYHLLSPTPNVHVIDSLWESVGQFLITVLAYMRSNKLIKFENILIAIQNHITDVVQSEHTSFAIDIASAKSDANSNIFDILFEKMPLNKINITVDIMIEKASDPSFYMLISNNVLSSFFKYLLSHFSEYDLLSQIFIATSYSRVNSIRSGIADLSFPLEIPEPVRVQARKKVEHDFTMFVSGALTSTELIDMLESARINDPCVFAYFMDKFVRELPEMLESGTESLQPYSSVLSELIIRKRFTGEKMQELTDFMVSSLSGSNSNRVTFTLQVLNKIFCVLESYPRFVFQLLGIPSLISKDSEFHAKLVELSKGIPEPAQATVLRELLMSSAIAKFETLSKPPPRVRNAIDRIRKDPEDIVIVSEEMARFQEWIALGLVKHLIDRPENLSQITKSVTESSSKFRDTVVRAACFVALKCIADSSFDSDATDGAFVRRSALVLGRLIGELTLAKCQCLPSRYLDLKKIIIHGFSQGKLYGTIPFVCAILQCANTFLYPPNPFMSGILQLLGSVLETDSVKMLIKHHILLVFEKMKVTVNMFSSLPNMFPEKVKNNFDFLIQPFSLLHFAQPNEVEQIIGLDEDAFIKFANNNIDIPDSPVIQNNPELRDRLRAVIAPTAFQIIGNESTTLSKIAASTTYELVRKDFNDSKDQPMMMSTAEKMCRELSTSLTLFTAPVKIARNLLRAIKKIGASSEEEMNYLEKVCQKNYEWIVQLFRDLVRQQSLKTIHKTLDLNELRKNVIFLPKQYSAYMKGGLQAEQMNVYDEMMTITLSQQPFPMVELKQDKEEATPVDKEFDAFLANFKKLMPVESVRSDENADYDETAIKLIMKQFPDMTAQPLTAARFKSITMTLLKNAGRTSHEIFDRGVCLCFEKIAPYVSQDIIDHMQSFFKLWIQSSIKSSAIICQLVKLKFVTTDLLDESYSEMLDKDPFSDRIAFSISRVLHDCIVEKKCIEARSMIRTLACLYPVQRSEIQDVVSAHISNGPAVTSPAIASALEHFDNQKEIYMNLATPISRHAATKAQVPNIGPAFRQCEQLFRDFTQTGFHVNELLEIGRPFFLYMIYYCAEADVIKFIDSMDLGQLERTFQPLINAAVEFTKGSLTKELSQKVFIIILRLYNRTHKSHQASLAVARVLHQIRPAVRPLFTFPWIDLVTYKSLVAALMSTANGRTAMGVLLCDFVFATTTADFGEFGNAFEAIYIALLRFVVILKHDFPSFLASVRNLIVPVIPSQFTQLKNIVNSAPSSKDFQGYALGRVDIYVEDKLDTSKVEIAVKTIEDACDIQGPHVRQFLQAAKTPQDAFTAMKHAFKVAAPDTVRVLLEGVVDMLAEDGSDTDFAVELTTNLVTLGQPFPNSKVSAAEVAVRILVERNAAAGPKPAGLTAALKKCLSDASPVWLYPFSKHQKVRDFLKKKQL